MITFYAYANERMLQDISLKKSLFGKSKVKQLGKNLTISIEDSDISTLESVINSIHEYGISSQVEYDSDISDTELRVLETY